MNETIAKGGCAKCAYHLWKSNCQTSGGYTCLQISSWPSREVYDKVHNGTAFAEAYGKLADLRAVIQEEFYDRYVEIK